MLHTENLTASAEDAATESNSVVLELKVKCWRDKDGTVYNEKGKRLSGGA